MAEIEKIASDRYRIRSHDQILTVDAQDLRDIFDYALRNMQTIENEALDRMVHEELEREREEPS